MENLSLNRQSLLRILLTSRYVYGVVGVFLAYMLLNFFASGFYTTLRLIMMYAQNIDWTKLTLSLFFSMMIGMLIALNMVGGYVRYRERQACAKSTTMTSIGMLGGLATGVCPLCVTGVFPILLSFLGSSFTFASLPFQGFEVQLVILVLLSVSLYVLARGSGRNYVKRGC